MNKLSKLTGCHPPHRTQEAALEAWHMQRNSYWTQHAIETSLWIFCFEDRLSLYSSVWPGTHCPVVSLLAQPYTCCGYRLKRPDLASVWEHLYHGPLTCVFASMWPTLLNLREACMCQVIRECGLAGDTRQGPGASMRNIAPKSPLG